MPTINLGPCACCQTESCSGTVSVDYITITFDITKGADGSVSASMWGNGMSWIRFIGSWCGENYNLVWIVPNGFFYVDGNSAYPTTSNVVIIPGETNGGKKFQITFGPGTFVTSEYWAGISSLPVGTTTVAFVRMGHGSTARIGARSE